MTQTTARILRADDSTIDEAAKIIASGGIVAYPTDTVYGLGCDPFNADSVDRLVKLKQRSKGALPILVDSMQAARKLGELNRAATILAGKFWPGPLTLVVPVRVKLPDPITDNSQFVGLRIPRHEIALKLIGKCKGNIVGTSANVSGQSSSRTVEDVVVSLGGQIELVLDGGPSPLGKESTVAKILGLSVEVLREGAISREEILKALKSA